MSDTSNGLVEDPAVESYLAAVGQGLGDVEDRDELLDELRAHLHEVRAEDATKPLEAVLGSPQAYADEMRVAAGLPVRGRRWRRRLAWTERRRRWAPSAAVYVRDLRSVWWALRGAAAGAFALVVLQAAQIEVRVHDFGITSYLLSATASARMLAQHWGSFLPMAELVSAVLGGVLVSVWLGGWLLRRATSVPVRVCVAVVGITVVWWFAGVAFVVLADGMIYGATDPAYRSSF